MDKLALKEKRWYGSLDRKKNNKETRMTLYKACSRNAVKFKSIECKVAQRWGGKGLTEISLKNHLRNTSFGRAKEFLVGKLCE